jgi:hypothetical protein
MMRGAGRGFLRAAGEELALDWPIPSAPESDMTFFDAYLFFNILSYPIDKASLPSEMDAYAMHNGGDSACVSRYRYEFLNDSLIRVTQWDSLQSTGAVSTFVHYWGLGKERRISFMASVPIRDSLAKAFNAFGYDGALLMSISEYSDGAAKGLTEFAYEDGSLIKETKTSLPANRKTFEKSFTWMGGRIVEAIEDFIGLKYKNAYTYDGDKVVQRDRTVLAGSSSRSLGKYAYADGRVVRWEDYDVDRLALVFHIRYGNPAALRERLKSAGPEPRSGATSDALGRAGFRFGGPAWFRTPR